MRTFFSIAVYLGCVFLLVQGLAAGPASAKDVDTQPLQVMTDPARTVVTLKGTSTLTDWSCETNELKTRVILRAPPSDLRVFRSFLRSRNPSEAREQLRLLRYLPLPQVYVKLPVHSLDCGNPPMKQDLLEAVRADSFPTILYRLNGLSGVPQVQTGSDSINVRYVVRGGLAIGGRAKTVTFPVHFQFKTPRNLWLKTSFNLNMKSFEITPPRAFLGLIEAHEVFEVQLRTRLSMKRKNALEISLFQGNRSNNDERKQNITQAFFLPPWPTGEYSPFVISIPAERP